MNATQNTLMKKKSSALEIRTVALFLVVALAASVFVTTVYAMVNPAAAYCVALEYQYKDGICFLPDGKQVDAWDFLEGKAAPEWSFCAKKGYPIKHIENSKICRNCGVCVFPDGKMVEVIEAMGLVLTGTTCGDKICRLPENASACPGDCPTGELDDLCDGIKDNVCDPDCAVQKGDDVDCLGTSLPYNIFLPIIKKAAEMQEAAAEMMQTTSEEQVRMGAFSGWWIVGIGLLVVVVCAVAVSIFVVSKGKKKP